MSFRRHVSFCASALALLLACSAAHAQIHEEKPTPGLDEGLVFWSGSDPIPNRTRHPQLFHPMSPADEAGTGDFSLSLFATGLDSASVNDEQIIAKHSGKSGWKLMVTSKGTLKFIAQSAEKADLYAMETPPGVVAGKKNPHIAVSIHRDARQPYSGISVDGIEVASGMMPPVSLSTPGTEVQCGNAFHTVDLRIYNRALTRPEILELMLRGSSGTASDKPKPKHPAPPPGGPRFIPQQDETIALIGGTEAVALAESGELEALLLMAFPQTRFHFRSLAWEGDTVFRQDRPMNFGSLEQQLRRVNAGAVFVMFGRQECLDAKDEGGRMKDEKGKPASASSLDSFKAAFEKLLATVEKVTPNIVVVSPPLFHHSSTGPDEQTIRVRNSELFKYSRYLGDIATSRGLTFVEATKPMTVDGPPRTRDGVTLTEAGIADVLYSFKSSLSLPGTFSVENFSDASADSIGRAIHTKNRLWHDYWRPSNWAFLHGDRTNQPSSRDPVNPQIRFFPAEQEKYLPLIKDAEDKVFNLVQEAQKKLP